MADAHPTPLSESAAFVIRAITVQERQRAAFAKASLWPMGARIPTKFIGTPNEKETQARAIVRESVQSWNDNSGVKFKFSGDADSDSENEDDVEALVRAEIVWGFTNSDSYLGTQCFLLQQQGLSTMLLMVRDGEKEQIQREALHEFGHAVGMVHEHQVPDAQRHLKMNRGRIVGLHRTGATPKGVADDDEVDRKGWDKAEKDTDAGAAGARTNIVRPFKERDLIRTQYDSTSIMHYEIPGFWKLDPSSPDTVQYNVLSNLDKSQIKKVYPTEFVNRREFKFGFPENGGIPRWSPDNRMKITFNPQYQAKPQIAVGLSALHIEMQPNAEKRNEIRFSARARKIENDSFLISARSWGKTKLYSCTPTWFDTKNDSSAFRVGLFQTGTNLPSTEKIKFEPAFESAPTIVVWLNKLHFTCGEEGRMHVKVSTTVPDKEGFEIKIETPAGGTLHRCAASWIAIPPGDARTIAGSFPVGQLDDQGDSKVEKEYEIPEGLRPNPEVLLGVNELNFDSKKSVCFRASHTLLEGGAKMKLGFEIPPLGFDTPRDTVCYGANISYLALKRG